jgi:hypothetical protein
VCSEVIKDDYQFLLVSCGAGLWCAEDIPLYSAIDILDNDSAASVKTRLDLPQLNVLS